MVLAIGCLAGLVFAPVPTFAQATVTYACQTPTFWCVFIWSPGVPNGTSCYCNTYMGPVTGYTIDPSGMNNAPTLPKPQRPTNLDPPKTRPVPEDPKIASDDCYKGLGNCPGSFTETQGRSGGDRSTVRSSRGSTGFAEALQKLIDAAGDEFSDVQGEAKRGTSTSDTYTVTVVPSGFNRCVLFIPHRTTRRPWVSCFSETLRYRELLRTVTDVLGPSAKHDGEEHTWFVDSAEVSVDNDDGEAGLSIHRRRDG
jgi:hypothetical protein